MALKDKATVSTPVSPEDRRLANKQAMTMALLFFGYAGYYVCRAHLSATRSLIIEDFKSLHFTKETIGMITSIATFFYAGGKFLAGTLSDKFGGNPMFLIGMAGAIVFSIMFGLGGSFPIFLFAWSANRFIQSMGWAGLVKVVSRWFPSGRYGTVMGLISLSYLLGDFVPKYIFGELINQGWGWRQIFFLAAGVMAIIFVPTLLFLRNSPTNYGLEEPKDPEPMLGFEAQEDLTAAEILKNLLASPIFWTVCVLSFGFTLMRETFNEWTPTYLHEVAHLSKGDASKAASYFPLFGGISVLIVGWLSDRLSKGGRSAMIVGGLALGTVALLSLSQLNFGSNSTAYVAVVAAIAFVLIGPYSLLAGAISLDLGGKKASATACGWIDGVGYVGGIISGYGVARIAEKSGWQAAFLMLAAVAFVSCIFAFIYWIQDRSIKPKTA